jgi:hypothetical protein
MEDSFEIDRARVRKDPKSCDHIGYFNAISTVHIYASPTVLLVHSVVCSMCGVISSPTTQLVVDQPMDLSNFPKPFKT